MSHAESKAGWDVVVVGAGPAGMMAALVAAEAGRRVCVLEHLDRLGAKLLATGGGRCNLTTTLPVSDIMTRFGRQGRFLGPALKTLDPARLRALFESLGVATHAPDGLHVYPVSDSARDVRKALQVRLQDLGVEMRTGVRATGLWIEGECLRGLVTEGAGRLAAGQVILATGGRGYPELGATGDGYALAREAGHAVVEPAAALVPLVVREAWVRELAGLSVPAVRVWIDQARARREGVCGDLLFTHHGLSGPAVLDLSGDVAVLLARRKGSSVSIGIDLTPGVSEAEWLARLDAWAAEEGAEVQAVGVHLARAVPRRLAGVLCGLVGASPSVRPGQVSRAARRALAASLAGLRLEVTATEGFERAMVTRGGVALKEVDPETLESRRLRGLFFAGELLDLDGPSGGFNLQWAFSSGYLAGRAAADR